MTTPLRDLQSRMQSSILTGDMAAAPLLRAPPPGTTRAARLGVYQFAYIARLTEFLENDFPKLRAYLGDSRFEHLARAYAERHPSDTPNARWFSRHLPEFLKATPPYNGQPELADLARLDQALNDAFDSAEAPVVKLADLSNIEPGAVATMVISLAPCLQRFSVSTNATSLWAALAAGEPPPLPDILPEPQAMLAWRQGAGARFRLLGGEEAMALDSAAEGVTFAVLCELLGTMGGFESAAARAAAYLRGWIESEIIARLCHADENSSHPGA